MVVVLEDAAIKGEYSSKSINSIVKDYERKLNILYYKSSSCGTYKLAVEIRKIFLNYAEDKDYAMILDSDDYFSSPNVVSDVITQMCKKKANMCLVGFEIFGKQDLNYAKNYHNVLVKRMANLDSYIQFVDYGKREVKEISDDLYLASTLGWTKCYQKPVLQKYQALYEGYDLPKEYAKLSKYEDFLDQLTLMFKDYANKRNDLVWDVDMGWYVKPFPVDEKDFDRDAFAAQMELVVPRSEWSSVSADDKIQMVAEVRELYFDEIADALYDVIDGFTAYLKDQGVLVEDNDERYIRDVVFGQMNLDYKPIRRVINEILKGWLS